MEEKRNNIIITPQIDLWSKENYPEEFLKLNNYIKSLPNITDKRFKRSTEINIRRIKGNFFDAYNLIVSHNLDKELLFDEIEQNANAETVHDLTGNSSCFGFTPALYSPLGYKELPLVMSARHIYLCTNPFGFYSDNLAHYHNLDISVLEDIPNNLNNVIFMYQGKRQTESIVSVLDYDIPIKDEFGNVTTNKTKLQLIIKPKPIGIKTFFSNLPIESNLLATAFEFNSINNERILYVNKNKKSLAQQLISHSIPNGRDRTEVVSNTGFYKKNLKYYIESVNKNLKLKEPFLYNEIFIDRINLEIEKSENPNVEDIIKNIKKDFLSTSPIPKNIQTISDSVLSFEQKDNDILEIIGKQFETDSSGKPTMDGMKQLSRAMEIYSDKRYETARYLFVKDGVITRHIAVSSQTPSSTIIKPDDKFLYELKNYAEETGSKIVFLHNHPSGYVEPSEADINLTDYLANFFEETDGTNIFSGHIILDHGTYGLYDSKDRSWNALINDEFKPLSKIKENYKIQLSEYRKKADFDTDYSITRQSLDELADYAKSCDSGNVWNRKDWIPSFLMTGNGIVTSLEYINTVELQNEESLSEKLKFLGRKYGSENIVMIPSDKQQFLLCERYAQDSGKIKDVFLKNNDGSFEVSEYRNGNIFNDLRSDEIKVEDTERNIEQVKEKIIYEQSVNNNINKENRIMTEETQIENEKNDISLFDKELQDYIDGKLNKSHIFSLGLPGEILQKCGFPANQRIELSASHLEFKSKLPRHIFDLSEIKGLEQALKNPVAVFEYGDRKKSQNVVVNIEKDGKNFLAGIHFNQATRGYEVSDIRTLYPKDNVEWLNWINQGKLIYGDKEKLQALIAQQRMNVAEVSTQVAQSPLYEHCLESASIILDKFTGVNDVFTDEYPFYNEVKEKASIEHKFFTFYVTKGNLDARELSVYEAEEFYNALKNNDTEKIKEYTDTDLHEIQEIAAEIEIEYDSKNIKNEHSQAGSEEISSNTINEKEKLKEKFIPDVKTEDIEEAMDISEDIMSPEQDKNTGKSENEKKLVEKINVLIQENQMLSQKLSTLEQQLLAPKEALEKSANDSMGQSYNNSSSVEHQNLTNQDGFGRETAYKKNQKVPTFGILQDDGSHQLIKNAVFSKLLVDEENPANNKIELLVLKENGKQEAIQIEEKLYNDIINNVQEFEQRKQGQSKDSWDWMMAHMNYAEKMGTDDNSFRLNTVGNFIHNFRVHCMRDEAHNPEQALKVAGIMFDRMAKREKERFLKMRKQWDKRAKINGGPTFDEHLIKQFNEFHPKKDINIEQIKGYHFDADEAVDKQNLMYESLRSGKIEGTNTNIGDTISFAMKYKDTFSGKHLKTPKEDWKIVEVSKCLSGDRALIYNEKSKAYYKIPLENLVEQIRKNERLKTKEEKQAIMQDHKKVGYDGPER